tara:strand:+ start:150 stop:458 length:309 start_codon:yes stop_codon:yes gene_type:complete
MSVSVLPSQFKPNKIGYKKYLKSLGFQYDGFNTPLFALTFEEFKYQSKDKVLEIEKRLEFLNDNLYHLLYDLGQDETVEGTDAYHLNINIKKLVYQLDELTK